MKHIFILFVFFIFISCNITKLFNNKICNNNLLYVKNIEKFFLNKCDLINSSFEDSRKIKSISSYFYSDVNNNFYLFDSVIFDQEGKAILIYQRDGGSKLARIYPFYDENGNRYLDITVSSNGYDTIYTLRKFDKFNKLQSILQYNIKRQEYIDFEIININLISDSSLNIKYECYDTYLYKDDINYKILLPYETKDIQVKMLNDSLVQTYTKRIVHTDTSYNSNYIDLYIIKGNFLIHANCKPNITKNIYSNFIEIIDNNIGIKKKFLLL